MRSAARVGGGGDRLREAGEVGWAGEISERRVCARRASAVAKRKKGFPESCIATASSIAGRIAAAERDDKIRAVGHRGPAQTGALASFPSRCAPGPDAVRPGPARVDRFGTGRVDRCSASGGTRVAHGRSKSRNLDCDATTKTFRGAAERPRASRAVRRLCRGTRPRRGAGGRVPRDGGAGGSVESDPSLPLPVRPAPPRAVPPDCAQTTSGFALVPPPPHPLTCSPLEAWPAVSSDFLIVRALARARFAAMAGVRGPRGFALAFLFVLLASAAPLAFSRPCGRDLSILTVRARR